MGSTERPRVEASHDYTGPASFVDNQQCAACHQEQYQSWIGSHHDLAMQRANEETVLGDFNGASLSHYGITSSFFKKDGSFFVNTEDAEGNMTDFEIKYTFGIDPLQQYLIEFPNGHYQALGIAWDTQPEEEGGQRWFHLYPKEKITHDDSLHWTGINQNWNFMCAECHSTNLKKNYDPLHGRYKTTWSEIDVSCQACHGPGSRHVEWAKSIGREKQLKGDLKNGLVVQLGNPDKSQWIMDEDAGTAKRSTPRKSKAQIETCARCHSRRRLISENYEHGRPLLDTHHPSLLVEGLYHTDGQIDDEVYVYGSFLQSRMYQEGVTCSNCHDPHSLKLRAPGNELCFQCHLPARFNTPSHHFHKLNSDGASCVACHMPSKLYMVLDARHDHSIRIPRPDLSIKLGTPNACNKCHSDRSTEWAVEAMDTWYGADWRNKGHFGEALHAGRNGLPGAEDALADLAGDLSQPNIARASALSLIRGPTSPQTQQVISIALYDDDPLVRTAALSALESLHPRERFQLAHHLLNDPVRAVRVEAGRVLATTPPELMSGTQRELLEKAAAQYIDAQRVNADRPEAHLNLGVFYAERGQFDDAEAAYRTALRLDPTFVPGLVNLADLYRMQQRDTDGEILLREALEAAPDDATVHYSLGLLLVRTGHQTEAIEFFKHAATLQADDPRYSYVYAIALNSIGKPDAAVDVLKNAHQRHPYDREVLLALVTINRDRGKLDSAIEYAEALATLSPQDQSAQRLLQQLRSQQQP